LDQFVPLREISVSLWRRNWFWALVLIAFVFIAYSQVFRAGFIWDDKSHLTRNPCVVGPLGLKEIWTSTQAVYYPLVLTTFWILHNVAGLNPLQYRLLNVCYMPPLQLCFGAFCDYSKFAEHGWALLYGLCIR
jgi:hypothetical protein